MGRVRGSGVRTELAKQDELVRPGRRRLLDRMCSWAWEWEPWRAWNRSWKHYRKTQYKVIAAAREAMGRG